MIDALENEDAFYQFENYSLKKQRGYYIYYETNQEMKNYMLAEGEMGHIPEQKERGRYSETIKRDTAVVRNYKKALKKKKNLRPKSVFRSPVYIGCGFAAALVFVYGIHTLAQFQGDDKTQTVFDQQKITDMKADSEEERLSDRQFGSTKSGIAPFFSDKFSKIGFQVWELFEPERLKEKIKNVIEVKNLMLEHIYHKPLLEIGRASCRERV